MQSIFVSFFLLVSSVYFSYLFFNQACANRPQLEMAGIEADMDEDDDEELDMV
jgi:regulatory protein YycI of two-component signal transduction system YycFG